MASYTITATDAILRDTLREALARKIFWGLFGLSTAMILFFLFILKIDIVEGAMATVTFFGRTADREMDVTKIIRGVEGFIAVFLSQFGLFLAIFASGGLIPSVLEPGRIELLLSKPVSRTHLLLGRYFGNLLIVSANAAYLVIGVWLILGVKTGFWSANFFLALAVTIFLFAVMLTLVVFIGVTTESGALAVMVPVALMIMGGILSQHELALRLLSSAWTRQLWQALYHMMPKVFDISRLILDFIRDGKVGSLLPVYTSAAFGTVMLAASIYIFRKRDF